ncbi:MAG: glycosyl hydrolase, partial [Bacteroidota bacterium]
NILYALLDNQEVDESLIRDDTIAGLTTVGLSKMSEKAVMDYKTERLDSFLRAKDYPQKYTGKVVQADLKAGKYTVKDLADYFGDGNAALFRTGIKGAELYRSDNGGKSWNRQHDDILKGVYYTYGYYFGQVRIAPDNPDEVYIFGVPLLRSTDAGASWSRLDTFKVHFDHHDLWINPTDADHMILGNDGGLYTSYDRGAHWTHINNLSVGQFYTVMVDMQTPYNVYGGLQDNGVLKGSSRSVPNRTDHWEFVFGGDGMYVVTDPKHPGLVYTGFQFGHYFRIPKSGPPKYITPKHDIGKAKYRWNWRTPVRSSPHNHEIIYMGCQYLLRSMNMGDTWEEISPDLTTNRMPQGNVPFSTISTFSESPKKFGLIWVGTDDGKVQVTTDGGNTWSDVGKDLPQGLWVSKVLASPHDKSTAFVALTGYRNDDFKAYVYKTTDLGKTWTSLKGNLPEEPVNVIIQDPVAADLLYMGTDHATYVSQDGGKKWHYMDQIPNVASYDMMVHPRENELVVATHGRSVYIVDVKPLQALQNAEEGQRLMVFAPKDVRHSSRWGESNFGFDQVREPRVKVNYFILDGGPTASEVKVRIQDKEGKTVYGFETKGQRGFNQLVLDLKYKKKGKAKFLDKGEYDVVLKLGFEERKVKLVLK